MSALIPKDVLDDILARLDPVAFISESVALKKAGKDFKGLCPFHAEKTPSFMVSPDKRIFYCFGCGEGGNLFKFLMKIENLSFPEAARKLARKAGVNIPAENSEEALQSDQKEIFYKINRYAAWFYEESLKGPAGAQARAYLDSRGIEPGIRDEFHLGLAPDGWEGLVTFLKEKKVPLELAEALGLIRKRKDGSSYYDFFRNRLMFPILDEEGRVIGFGGRRLNDASKEEAKYINSPESPVYHKGEGVYGLAQTKKTIREKGELVLVEGYMDLIALHQAGIKNAVAPLGTALTPQQIRYLTRFAPQFVVMFDGDEAGKRAFFKSLNLFLNEKIHPKVVRLPENHDPDSYIREKGASEMEGLVREAKPAVEWILLTALSQAGRTPSSRTDAVQRVLPYIRALPSMVEQKGYLAHLSRFLGLNESAFNELITRVVPTEKSPIPNRPKPKISLERNLLQLYVIYPQRVHDWIQDDFFSYFENEEYKEAGISLYRHYQEAGDLKLEQFEGEFANLVTELAFEKIPLASEDEINQFISDCFGQWKKNRLKKELTVLTGEIQLAEMQGDPDLLRRLLLKKNETLSSLKDMG